MEIRAMYVNHDISGRESCFSISRRRTPQSISGASFYRLSFIAPEFRDRKGFLQGINKLAPDHPDAGEEAAAEEAAAEGSRR